MKIGAHLSIAGGLHNALTAAAGYGFQTVAMFVRNQRQWAIPDLSDDNVSLFHEIRAKTGISPVVGHGSYLVNLAGNSEIRKKSALATEADLQRAMRLGIDYYVIHPGSNPDLDLGIKLITDGLNGLGDPGITVLLETTAGQGNCIGHRFEHLASILDGLERPDSFGVCLDTAHVFGAGYDIRTKEAWDQTMDEFDSTIGIANLRVIHCNDSLRPLGSRKDRHAHIGQGEIGIDGFRAIVNDSRIKDIPLILETPKGERDDGKHWDQINADLLRELAG